MVEIEFLKEIWSSVKPICGHWNLLNLKQDTIAFKYLQRVPLDISIHRCYLHQDAGRAYSEISIMESHRLYSEANICRHTKNYNGDLMSDLRQMNQGRSPNLFKK